MGYQYAYGIDIGGTTVKIGLFTAEGCAEGGMKEYPPVRLPPPGGYVLFRQNSAAEC